MKKAINSFLVSIGWYRYKVVYVSGINPSAGIYMAKLDVNQDELRILYGMSYIRKSKLGKPITIGYTRSKKNLYQRIQLKEAATARIVFKRFFS